MQQHCFRGISSGWPDDGWPLLLLHCRIPPTVIKNAPSKVAFHLTESVYLTYYQKEGFRFREIVPLVYHGISSFTQNKNATFPVVASVLQRRE